MTDKILTLSAVAQLLQIAEKTVHSMAAEGVRPALDVGGQWRFKCTDIDAWFEQQKLEAPKGTK